MRKAGAENIAAAASRAAARPDAAQPAADPPAAVVAIVDAGA